ncbi:MAG: hypothetical protein GC178_10140 [Flavobacteriales bacterium]|nr:hypothetical protein [Flavobacteriales bacterium]
MFEQGDIVAVDFPFTDGSATKKRPAIVISNESISATGDAVILMVTSKRSSSISMIELTPELLTSPLPKNSFAKCHRIHTIDAMLISGRYSKLTDKGMDLVRQMVVSVIS